MKKRVAFASTTYLFLALAVAPIGCWNSPAPSERAGDIPQEPKNIAASDIDEQSMERFENPTESDVPRLTELVRTGGEDQRKDAALALGTIGASSCVAPMLEALADDDDHMRSSAMIGIKRGLAAHRCTKEFLEAMFPALEKLLNRKDMSVSGSAPALLLEIDSMRAIPILLAPEYFSTDNSQLHYILRAFNHTAHIVPHDKLLPLLVDLKPKPPSILTITNTPRR